MKLLPVVLLLVCSRFTLTENITASDLVCPSEPIEAVKSKDVMLPCHLEPPMDASAETVQWKQGKDVVLLHKAGEDLPSEQCERFKGRTSLFSEGLTEGNLSLMLSSVSIHDDGRYQCSLHIESLNKMCYIKLTVEPNLVCPSKHIEVISGEDVILPCRLEPTVDASGKTVKWRQKNNTIYLHEKGKHNPAEEKERFKGRISLFPEGLTKANLSLKISSVDLRDNGRYHCCYITESIERCCSVILTVDELQVVGSHEPVTEEVGHDVVLPCHVEPEHPLANFTLEWKLNNAMVHLYRSQKDDPEMQDQRFKNRTSLFHEELVHGNISLKLTNITKEDAGNYSCYIPKLPGKMRMGNVTLNIVNTEKCTCPAPKKKDEDGRGQFCCNIAIGLGLGLGIPLVLCICLIFFILRKQRSTQAERGEENDNNLQDVANNHDEE